MFSLPFFLQTPEEKKVIARWKQEEIDRRLKHYNVVDWSPDIEWSKELNIRAESYQVRNLFPDCPVINTFDVNKPDVPGIVSPGRRWLYAVMRLPRGTKLDTWYGAKIGSVMFDGPVLIPSLHEASGKTWKYAPWMSHTPAEVISLRGGTKRAKGSVIVAGLGLGYQLVDVALRKQVTSLTLVERDRSLVDWLLPVIRPYLGRFCDDLKLIVGDAFKELPKLHADVALVDIFDSYGHNDYDQRRLRESCDNIKYIWCWGTAQTKDRDIW